MATFVTNCPLCKAKHSTFDIEGSNFRGKAKLQAEEKEHYELFGVCRNCKKATIVYGFARSVKLKTSYTKPNLPERQHFTASDLGINEIFEIKGYQCIADFATARPPQNVPKNIEEAFLEGAKSLAIDCPNASGVMFRRCVDLMIKDKHPTARGNNLKDKLNNLFADGHIIDGLKELAHCIREDGNDAAHNDPISIHDANDLLDFTTELLRQTYTMPGQVKQAQQRVKARRTTGTAP